MNEIAGYWYINLFSYQLISDHDSSMYQTLCFVLNALCYSFGLWLGFSIQKLVVIDGWYPLQLWNNLRNAYGDQPDLVELVETLSQNFETLYENKVCTFLFSLLSLYTFDVSIF